jgi:CBS domain-containing protein
MTAAKNKRGAKGGKGGGSGSGLVWVAPEASMSDAARLMVHHDVNLLPVCEGGEGGKVIGVVTRHDVMRALYASGSPFLK